MRLSATSAASSLKTGSSFFRAGCGAGVSVGDVVYLLGTLVGGLPGVDTVDIDTDGKSPGVGIVIRKRTSTECIIQVSGIIRNVFTGFTLGQFLFVAPGGSLTDSIPAVPTLGKRAIQNVGSVLKNDEVLLDIKPPTYRIPL